MLQYTDWPTIVSGVSVYSDPMLEYNDKLIIIIINTIIIDTVTFHWTNNVQINTKSKKRKIANTGRKY